MQEARHPPPRSIHESRLTGAMMDDRIRKRILAFYFAGFFNLALGLYVLINGRSFLEQGTWMMLMAFFFGFAAVDFWFPRVLKRRWREAQEKLDAQRRAAQQQAKK
jgi:uncharacterized membrane protein